MAEQTNATKSFILDVAMVLDTLRSRISEFFSEKSRTPPLLKKSQNWKERVFSTVFISHLGLIFQPSIYQVIFLNLIFLFSHCFSTFFLFHKLQLCSYIDKFWYIYVIGIKINKSKSPLGLFHSPAYHISLNFQTPCLLRPPPSPVYSAPKSTSL